MSTGIDVLAVFRAFLPTPSASRAAVLSPASPALPWLQASLCANPSLICLGQMRWLTGAVPLSADLVRQGSLASRKRIRNPPGIPR